MLKCQNRVYVFCRKSSLILLFNKVIILLSRQSGGRGTSTLKSKITIKNILKKVCGFEPVSLGSFGRLRYCLVTKLKEGSKPEGE